MPGDTSFGRCLRLSSEKRKTDQRGQPAKPGLVPRARKSGLAQTHHVPDEARLRIAHAFPRRGPAVGSPDAWTHKFGHDLSALRKVHPQPRAARRGGEFELTTFGL